jgi:hypothetical protein
VVAPQSTEIFGHGIEEKNGHQYDHGRLVRVRCAHHGGEGFPVGKAPVGTVLM